MDVIITILSIILLLFIIISIAGSVFFYNFAILRKPRRRDTPVKEGTPWAKTKPILAAGTKWVTENKTKRVQITSFDGLKLVADILENKEKSKKFVLMIHGFRAQDYEDFAVSTKLLYESGYNIILPQHRAHSDSEGKYITFGVNERFDCRDWINYIIKEYGESSEIFLMGVSMGAATVLMALGFNLPKNVKAVVADCGFTSPIAIFKHVVRNAYHLPPFPFVYGAELISKILAHFSIRSYSTLIALKTNKIPVLFIHGGKDDFVPVSMTMENYEKCTAPKELLIIDDATHATSFIYDTKKCWKRVSAFFNTYS